MSVNAGQRSYCSSQLLPQMTLLSFCLQFSLLLGFILFWGDKRTKELVHVNEVVAIVVLVGGVMDSMVTGAHDWISPAFAHASIMHDR